MLERDTHRFSQDEGIGHQIEQGRGGVHIVEGVRCLQAAVHRVVHDGGGQRVKTQKVSHLPIVLLGNNTKTLVSKCQRVNEADTLNTKCCYYLHQVSVDNVLSGKQPVFHLFLVHGRHQAELAEVLAEEPVHHRHILLGHWPQTLSLWRLR